MKNIVSTIVRFHDMSMLPALSRAVQSLHGQVGVTVQPIIVTQRLRHEDLAAVEAAVQRQWFFAEQGAVVLINYEDGKAGDARTALLNVGIEQHRNLGNRYLAFLDCDDILYTHAYRALQLRLVDTGAAFAFAMVERARVISLHDYDFVYEIDRPFKGGGKLDMLKDNFSPIHSYLVDTSKIPQAELWFNEELSRLEDYEFLLRVASKYPCDFSEMKRSIGLYCMPSDERNSTPTGTGSEQDVAKSQEWDRQRKLLAKRRTTFEVKFYASDFSA